MINILDKIDSRNSSQFSVKFNVMLMKTNLFNLSSKKSIHKLFGINYKFGEVKKDLYQILDESFTYRTINLGQGLISKKSRICKKVIPEDTFFYDGSEEKIELGEKFPINAFKIGEEYKPIKNVELQKCNISDINRLFTKT